jgi:hypothetical protein
MNPRAGRVSSMQTQARCTPETRAALSMVPVKEGSVHRNRHENQGSVELE